METPKHATWQQIHSTLKNTEPRGGIAPAVVPHVTENITPLNTGPGTVVDVKFSNSSAPASTTVDDQGGKKLAGTIVHICFWGDAWSNTPAPNPSLNQVLNDAAGIIGSVYLNAVGQYNAGTTATLGNIRVTTPGENPPTNYTMSQVNSFVLSVINGGGFPQPSLDVDNLYFVIMPPGTNPPPNLGGEHSVTSVTDYEFPFSWTTIPVYTAFVAFSSRSAMSSIFSHELVEAVTDPDGSGIQVNPTNPNNWNEVGDICQGSNAVVNGINVQAYWSQSDKSCVIPELEVLQMEIRCITKPNRASQSDPMIGVGGYNHTQNQTFYMTQKQCIASIDQGNQFFVAKPGGGSVPVEVFSHWVPGPDNLQLTRYIATVPDNTKADNLLSLPECS